MRAQIHPLKPVFVLVPVVAMGLVIAFECSGWIRNTLSDVLVVVAMAALAATLSLGTSKQRLLSIGCIAIGMECLQLLQWVDGDAPLWAHLFFGSTFDPLDLLAYAGGLGLAACAEVWWRPEPGLGDDTA